MRLSHDLLEGENVAKPPADERQFLAPNPLKSPARRQNWRPSLRLSQGEMRLPPWARETCEDWSRRASVSPFGQPMR
jgi:hypothetical protein